MTLTMYQDAVPTFVRALIGVIASAPLLTLLYQWGTKYLVHDHHLLVADVGARGDEVHHPEHAGQRQFVVQRIRSSRSRHPCALQVQTTQLTCRGRLQDQNAARNQYGGPGQLHPFVRRRLK